MLFPLAHFFKKIMDLKIFFFFFYEREIFSKFN